MADKSQSQLPRQFLEIHSATGLQLSINTTNFCVEIADEPHEWQKGLMFRKKLEERSGMLFIYPRSERHTMWMKNTGIALDMFFLDSKGKIVSIAENTAPFSHKTIDPGRPVIGVLELRAGSAQKYNIRKGDSIHHHSFNKQIPTRCQS